MIFGFDAKRIMRNRTGLGSYGRTLVNDLAHIAGPGTRLNLYAPDAGHDDLRAQVDRSENVSFCYPGHCHSRLGRDLWRVRGIVKTLQNDGVGLFHGLSGELPLGIAKAGIRTVVTIHDVIFLRHPEYYKWLDTRIYAWKFRHTCRQADRIIAISECTKRDIVHFANVSPDKISVIYQSCSTRFKQPAADAVKLRARRQYHLPGRYIVNVGTIEERKNILLAVKALPMLPADIHLVMVGRQTPYARKVRRWADSHGLSQRVIMLQGVPDDMLPAIYQMAEACVYPSRYEGFGIPIIEAIQSGLPVVACKGSCLEEAGGPQSLYVDPDDAPAMARAIARVLCGAPGRERRISDSRQYVTRFEGNNVAEQVMQVYRSMAVNP